MLAKAAVHAAIVIVLLVHRINYGGELVSTEY